MSDKTDGKLYSIDKHGNVRVLLDGLILSNGLDWSADGKYFYHTDSGTKLDEWMPGEILYDNAVNNAKLAMRTSEIVGILWHQGENDSHFEEDATTYQERFVKMIIALRKELGNENLLVIVGELGRFAKEYQSDRCVK